MKKNPKLKHSLKLLTKEVYRIFKRETDPAKQNNDPAYYFSIRLMELKEQVEKIPEFYPCVDIMLDDESISKIIGNLVGTQNSRTSVGDANTCIFNFIAQMYISNPTYSDELFDYSYILFEELFYEQYLQLKSSSRLHNFSSDLDAISLTKSIKVRKSEDSYQFPGLHKRYFSESNFILEREFKTVKVVGDITDSDEKIPNEATQTRIYFDKAIDAFRIFKSSAVFRDERVITEYVTYHPQSGTSIQSPLFENTAVGKKLHIVEEDLPIINQIFKYLVEERNSRFHISVKRLSGGYERKKLEDRLIDYMIGLEALYLPDGSHELSYRLSLRIAHLLEHTPEEKKETYNYIREMYNIRSLISHGKNYTLNKDDVDKLEETLRKSIYIWINDKTNFETNQYSNSGRLKKYGKLDEIIFT